MDCWLLTATIWGLLQWNVGCPWQTHCEIKSHYDIMKRNYFLQCCPLYVGNWPVTSGFPSQMDSNAQILYIFAASLNKPLNKHSFDWWFEMPWWLFYIAIMSWNVLSIYQAAILHYCNGHVLLVLNEFHSHKKTECWYWSLIPRPPGSFHKCLASSQLTFTAISQSYIQARHVGTFIGL